MRSVFESDKDTFVFKPISKGKGGRKKRMPTQTNADRIRSMTDEELRKFLCDTCDCSTCRWGQEIGCVLDEWLQQPWEGE